MEKRRGFPPVYKIERVAKMSVKRAFFGVLQKIMVICCAIFFGFTNAFSANLPSGYTELEYIESTGTQYIDTGIYGTEHHGMEIKYSYPTLDSGYSGRLCGGRTGAGSENAFAYIATSNGTLAPTNNTFYVSSNNGTALTLTPLDTGIHMASINFSNNQKSYFDGQEIQTGGKTTSYVHQFTTNLFRAYNGTSGWATPARARIYFCKITDSGALVRDFVPAKNSSGVVGMYDTVNDVFYTNQGTGEFTAGPVVLDSCRNLFDKDASYALFDGYVHNKSVGQSTTLNAYAGGDKTIIIKVAPDTTYTVTRATNLGSVYDRIRCAAFKTLPSGGSTGVILYNDKNTTQANATFTTLSDTQYVAINVRNSGEVGNDWTQFVDAFQLEQGSTATEYVPYNASCHNTNAIKIATTAYNAARFSPVKTDLDSAVATIREIVTKTINQTAAIASLQADKQTRPEDACPAGKKCLLVETEENGVIVPHWFPIIENIYGLPAGYTALEYIQSTGTQYIDTGWKVTQPNIAYDLRYQITDSSNQRIAGCQAPGYSNGATLMGNGWTFANKIKNEVFSADTNVHSAQFVCSNNECTYTRDAETMSATLGTFVQNDVNFALFGILMGERPSSYAQVKIYHFKIYDNGVLVRDFIPAKNSSNVVGMYDTVNNVFYQNAGTGTFTAGPEM